MNVPSDSLDKPTPGATRSVGVRAAIQEAQALLQAGANQKALKRLSAVLHQTDAPIEAWALCATAWWGIARTGGGPAAYASSADAMQAMLQLDPAQQDLWFRSGCCRLLQAEGEVGLARHSALEAAVGMLRRAVAVEGADELRLTALGDSLLQLAQTTEVAAHRSHVLREAIEVLRTAADLSEHSASLAAWKLHHALQHQASRMLPAAATEVLKEVDRLLSLGVQSAAAPEHAVWRMAKLANDLARVDLAAGAAKLFELRSFRAANQAALTGEDASPEHLLIWLALIIREAAHMRGENAQRNLQDLHSTLDRLDAMLPWSKQLVFIRARMTRHLSRHLSRTMRELALSDAIQRLLAAAETEHRAELRLEAAEALLEKATCLTGPRAEEQYACARALAEQFIMDPVYSMIALRCVIEAQVGSGQRVDMALCDQLLASAEDDPIAREVLARAAFQNGMHDVARNHFAAAGRLRGGARLSSELQSLWEQAQRLARDCRRVAPAGSQR